MPVFDESTFALIAIAVSLLSLLVAGGTFVWTVTTLHPKARLSAHVLLRVGATGSATEPFIVVSVLNEGPGSVRIQPFIVVEPVRQRSELPKSWTVLVVPDQSHFTATDLARPLEAGEEARLVVPYDSGSFIGAASKVGIQDNFGRITWAGSGEVRKARRQHRGHFPEADVRFVVPDMY